ncbi:zinc metalloproteinase nas-13-like protein, partial [Leptotrombidium deliense]
MLFRKLFSLTILATLLKFSEQSNCNVTKYKRNFDTNAKVWINRWKGGIVPYVFDSSFPVAYQADVQCAINEYHAKTCIRFVPRTGQSTYLTIGYDPQQCGVAYGTRVDIGDRCSATGSRCGVLLHELGHILGYAHEQDRPDRDQYISGPGLGPVLSTFETFCLMYDYVSIEHYEDQCSTYGGPWTPRLAGVTKCGGGNKIGVLDTNKFNTCYDCKGCLGYRWMGIKCFNPSQHVKVEGGYDIDGTTKLYVCRGWHHGDIIPGKGVFPSSGAPYCYIGHFNQEFRLFDFEVLTNSNGANLQWAVTENVPPGALGGGRVTDRTTYYIGR